MEIHFGWCWKVMENDFPTRVVTLYLLCDVFQVQKYARPLARPQLTGDSSPVVVEEYTFETERRDGRVNMSRLVIMQRLSDESYLGTLYVDRDFKDSDQKGNACRLVLCAVWSCCQFSSKCALCRSDSSQFYKSEYLILYWV